MGTVTILGKGRIGYLLLRQLWPASPESDMIHGTGKKSLNEDSL